ncbi:MAG: tetratricopeptide repeat protein [Myxococcales bacterium]|nr:tetratricopeptide repeat protein [Myxococcales bacterium]
MSETTQDLLRGELERLFELDEMTSLSSELLGYEPSLLGGTSGKGSFARALVDRCLADSAIEALADAMRLFGKAPDVSKVFDVRAGRSLEPGEELAGFRIAKHLAEGGLGRIFLAEREEEGGGKTRAAIKLVRMSLSRDPSAVARFLTGQRALKRVPVEGIAAIHACGMLDDGRPWVATEYLEGQTLAARLQRVGPMHINEARPILRGVLEALQRLHDRGLVHADVKSGNVFVVRPERPDGTRGEPTGVLVDAGAHRLLAAGATRPDTIGALRVFGNAHAVAPEMARGEPIGPASDIYAAGVMLYELLTGQLPFVGKSAFEVVAKHLAAEPAPASSVAPKGWVTKDLDALIDKALAKDPADRFASARELLEAIEQLARAKMKKEPLDESAFAAAADAVRSAPTDADAIALLEEVIAPADAWEKAAELYVDVAGATDDVEAKKGLLFRVARIRATETRDREGASAAYRAILEVEEGNLVARSGLEELTREAGDHEALVELLLERLDHIEATHERAAVLREIGALYEDQLADAENALVAYSQALADEPGDDKTARAIERLCGTSTEHWGTVLEQLNEVVQEVGDAPEAVPLYLRLGRWYGESLKRPDFALPCFAKVVEIDSTCDEAYEGSIALYERSRSWPEVVQILEAWAAATSNPAAARDHRARAADIVLRKLSDQDRAVSMFEAILAEDPTHPTALAALATLHAQREEWPQLAALLEQRVKVAIGEAKVPFLLELAELCEDRLGETDKAIVHYESAAELDPRSLDALKGLERIFARQSNYPKLMEVLEKQLELTATPRQKIAILEHLGAIHEEELLDVDAAITCYEQVVGFDPGHEGANPALTRLYRQKGRFDDLVATLERHAKSSDDVKRKTDLLFQAARALMADVGAPERAIALAERVVTIDPEHAEALTLLARLRAQTGDASSAVEAVDRLADGESDPKKKAERFVEAARLLEESGDHDRAIERYKRALDADESSSAAAESLRRLYAKRGDAHGVAGLLLREIEATEGKSRKAELHAELGHLAATRLEDPERARMAFEMALQLDATCTSAARGLGDLAFEDEAWAEAARHFEPLLARTSELSAEDAKRISLRCGDSFAKLSEWSKAQRAYLNAKSFAPEDRDVLERVADVTYAAAEWDEAAELYRGFLDLHGAKLEPKERGQALYRFGDALRRSASYDEAAPLLDEAAQLRPEDPAPLRALRDLHAAKKEWDLVVRVLRRRMEQAGDLERFDLLVEVGDVLLKELGDREKAAKSYVAALEVVPDDRNLLTKLMAVYSETKDWSRLVEVILRIAELVDDPPQQAKYYLTAASIAKGELGRHEEAADYYAQALENDGASEKAFLGLVECLEKGKRWDELADAYRARIERKRNAPAEERAKLFDALGALYEEKLEDAARAAEAYEQAQELDADGRRRLEKLAEIYGGEPKRFFRKALDTHAQLLRKSPYRVESYQALRELYTDAKRADESWCVCQVLKSLAMAGPDEESFFKKHRSKHPAAAQAFFDEDIWFNHITHADQDPLLTGIFAAITPAVVATRSQDLDSYGLANAKKRNPETDESVMVRTLHYVAGVTQVPLPDVYYLPDDPGGVSVLFSSPPALGVGQAALAGGPAQALAFVAARQMAYFRPGHYLRHLVPSGSGLRAWLLAAIKLATPQFPVPKSLVGKVDEHLGALRQHLDHGAQAEVRSLVQQLLAAAPELDMKRWVAAVDQTADRVGFVMANDLEIAVALIKASPDDAATQKERLKELYLFSVSTEYLELRQKLGITIDG